MGGKKNRGRCYRLDHCLSECGANRLRDRASRVKSKTDASEQCAALKREAHLPTELSIHLSLVSSCQSRITGLTWSSVRSSSYKTRGVVVGILVRSALAGQRIWGRSSKSEKVQAKCNYATDSMRRSKFAEKERTFGVW